MSWWGEELVLTVKQLQPAVSFIKEVFAIFDFRIQFIFDLIAFCHWFWFYCDPVFELISVRSVQKRYSLTLKYLYDLYVMLFWSQLFKAMAQSIFTGGSLKGGAGVQWHRRVSWGCEYPWEWAVESVPVLVCLREFVLMQLVCNSL